MGDTIALIICVILELWLSYILVFKTSVVTRAIQNYYKNQYKLYKNVPIMNKVTLFQIKTANSKFITISLKTIGVLTAVIALFIMLTFIVR